MYSGSSMASQLSLLVARGCVWWEFPVSLHPVKVSMADANCIACGVGTVCA